MSIATSTNSAAWSSNVAVTNDCMFQCQGGAVRVTWDTGASIGDGMILQDGQAIVIPGGNTFRWAPLSSSGGTVFYEEFA